MWTVVLLKSFAENRFAKRRFARVEPAECHFLIEWQWYAKLWTRLCGFRFAPLSFTLKPSGWYWYTDSLFCPVSMRSFPVAFRDSCLSCPCLFSWALLSSCLTDVIIVLDTPRNKGRVICVRGNVPGIVETSQEVVRGVGSCYRGRDWKDRTVVRIGHRGAINSRTHDKT